MRDANYAVIKFIPDLSRNEPMNIGVLAWCDGAHILRFDSRSFRAITRRSPDLAQDALELMTQSICASFADAHLRDGQDYLEFMREALRSPFKVTEPLFVGIDDSPDSALEAVLSNEVDILLERLVRPSKRRPTKHQDGPRKTLWKVYKKLFEDDQVVESYEVKATQTGLTRQVDFYLNHGTDMAVDVLDLNNDSSRQHAMDTADSMRSKSIDMLYGAEVKHIVAHLPADIRPGLQEHVALIRTMLKVEARVILTTSVEENEMVVRELAPI